MLKTIFLTSEFYAAYSACTEIEQKETRPYIRVQVMVDGVLWGIPLRSSIPHDFAIWTDKANRCGIDLTKAVVIEHPKTYISSIVPHIRPEEFKVLKRIDEYTVVQKFNQYIRSYKKAKLHADKPRNRWLLLCSTLQYFENYI